jgi:outer membrane lipoprotein-sorting protein
MLTKYAPQGVWSIRLSLGLLGLFFFTGGCTKLTPLIKPKPRAVTAEEAISLIKQRNNFIQNLSTTTRLTLATPEGQKSFSASMLVQKPNSIRVEILNMFMQPIQFLVSNEHSLWWYIPTDKKVLKGTPSSLNIYRLLGIRLSVANLVNILLGCAELPASAQMQPTISHLDSEHRCLLRFCSSADSCPYQIWLHPTLLYGMRYFYTDEFTMNWEAIWENFEQLQNYYLPTLIKLERLDRACRLELKYDQPMINTPLPQDKFRLELPPGVEIVKLEK